MTTYKHLGERPLQHFYSIEIEDINDAWHVFFCSTIHVNKRLQVGPSYSKSYTHEQILRDRSLIRTINMRYGPVTKPDAEAPY